MNGQSLPQSGTEGLLGQHGISSGVDGAVEAAAMGSPVAAAGMAIAGRTIGASARPPMANKARKYATMDRRFITSTYHSPIIFKHAFCSRTFTGC
jgi:hypothetical protein